MTEQTLETVQTLEEQIFYRRKIGMNFRDIAAQLNIKPDDAVKIHRRFMIEIATEYSVNERDQIIAMEMERLDSLVMGYYVAGMEGDLDSAKFALSAMQYRAKLLRLDQPTPDELSGKTQFIVVSGTKEDFEEALRSGRDQYRQVTSHVRDDSDEED